MNKKTIKSLMVFIIISIIIYLLNDKVSLKNYFENFALWLYPKNEDRNAELLKILLSIIGGLGILYTLYLGYKKSKVADKNLVLQFEAINNQSEQLELSRKSQVDERFKNAVEHLGNDKEPIILGGVVELHQIAKEDMDKYASVVFNILTSYLRTKLKVNMPREEDFSSTIPQTIIDFLFRGDDFYLYKKYKANLSHCNFLSMDLCNCEFIESDFSFSLMPMDLKYINFERAKFSRTNFTIGRLENVNFKHIEFHNNLFNHCQFKNVDFSNSEISGELFVNCIINDSKFINADLYNCKFLLCHFENTFFLRNEMLNIKYLGCNFININFLENKTFSSIDFTSSGFEKTTFDNECFKCNFTGIQLKYNFDFIQLKDIQENIGKKINKNGIKELANSYFLNCDWNEMTQVDFNLIEEEFNEAVKNWDEKYSVKKKQK